MKRKDTAVIAAFVVGLIALNYAMTTNSSSDDARAMTELEYAQYQADHPDAKAREIHRQSELRNAVWRCHSDGSC